MESKNQEDSENFQPYFESNTEPEPLEQEFKEKPLISNPESFLIPKLAVSLTLLPLSYIQANQVVNRIPNSSILTFVSQAISSKGLSGLYRGFDSLLLARSINHFSVQFFSPIFKAALSTRSGDQNVTTLLSLLCISFTNTFISAIFASPIESLLIRSQTLSGSSQKEYSSLSNALKHLKAKNELGNLFKGTLGHSIFKGFGTMFFTLWSFIYYFPEKKLSGYLMGIGSACASLSLLYPIEFLRITMQNKASSDKTITYGKIFSETVKFQGISGLYYGFGVFCLSKLAYGVLIYSLIIPH